MKTLLIIAVLLLGCVAMLNAGSPRPTREYVVWYDDGQSRIVEADSLAEALALFEATTKHERVFAVAQRSYVATKWIWPGK